MKKRDAPKGDWNARRHGFYGQVLDEAEKLHLEQARDIEGVDEEIAILRVKLRELVEKHLTGLTFTLRWLPLLPDLSKPATALPKSRRSRSKKPLPRY